MPDTAAKVYLARAIRDFGDGFVAILLPVYLIALGLSAFEVGVVATFALLGSAILTLGIGVLGARRDHRGLLLAASGLMAATGLAYAAASDYAILLVVAFVGTINPSGGSTSIFVPLEHTVLSGAVAPVNRTRAFARYSLIGALAGLRFAARGRARVARALGMEKLAAIKAMFLLYAVPVYWRTRVSRATALGAGGASGSRPALDRQSASSTGLRPCSASTFAGGFVVQSLLALWLFERFELSLTSASLFFFTTGVLSAFSFPVCLDRRAHDR